MGLLGILLGLGLLIWLAFRGWSILLLAPAAALLAAAAAGEPLLAHWTQTFMGSAAGFLAQFFPLFLLGALFGKLMEDSGSVSAIASFMTERLGPRRAVLAVVLAGALVTYGGVSLFVALFVLAPMAQALFRTADIPHRLMPAAIALGSFTFTMSALPGTPAIQNAIPMPFFGTTPFAAPGLGIIAAAIMLGFGLWWLGRAEAAARRAGEGYGGDAGNAAEAAAADELVRERATTAREFDPAEIRHGRHSETRATGRPRPAAADRGHRRQSPDGHVCSAATRRVVPGGGALGRQLAGGGRRRLGGGGGAGCRNPDADPGQPPAPAGAAREHGRGRQCFRPARVQRREPGRVRRGRRRAAGLCAGARLGAVDRGRAAGLAGGRDQRARRSHRLGLGRPHDRARRARRHLHADRGRDGIDPALMHRVAVIGAGTLDSLPHNGAVVTLLAVCGSTHGKSYLDILMVAIVGAILALIAVIVLGTAFGSF